MTRGCAAAAQRRASGHTVYPFHLGDLDWPLARHTVKAMDRAVHEGRTGYCPGAGVPELREALAAGIGGRGGTSPTPENITVMTGGKPVITKFVQAVMNPGEEVLHPAPGFPIYESQIEFRGGVARPYRYVPTAEGFAIDLDHVRSLITDRTVAIIYNDLQNPTSAESTAAEREALARLAIDNDLWVLSDEAYLETRYEGRSTSSAACRGWSSGRSSSTPSPRSRP